MRRLWWIILCACPFLPALTGELARLAAQSTRGKNKAAVTARPPKFDALTLELFSENALSKLGPGEPGAGRAGAGSQTASDAGGAGSEGAVPDDADPTGGGSDAAAGFAWSSLVSAAALEDEIKEQLAPVAEAIETSSAFKGGGNKAVGRHYGIAAAVFHVIDKFDGEVRWKKDAAGLRSLFARSGFNSSKVNSDDAFKEAKLRHQDLTELIGGGKVSPPKAEEASDWSKIVARPTLMQRMDLAYQQRLKAWTADAGSLKKQAPAIAREAHILAMLAQIIQDESYEDASNDSYREYAGTVQQQALSLAEAADSANLDDAQKAVSLIYRACDSCHGDYKGT